MEYIAQHAKFLFEQLIVANYEQEPKEYLLKEGKEFRLKTLEVQLIFQSDIGLLAPH
jgi:hypothetical protein